MDLTKYFLAVMIIFCLTACATATDDAEKKDAEKEPQWVSLFNGKDLDGWKAEDFGGSGKVTVEEGGILKLAMGAMITGVVYEKDFPTTDFEIELEARRTQGNDFFAAVTFPVGEAFCTFVTGGWGGGVFGISCVNGYDASENSTSKYFNAKDATWYKIRVRVTEKRICTWMDDTQIVDCDRDEKQFSTRYEVRNSQPMGITNYCSESELRNIRYRLLSDAEKEPAE